MICVAQAKASLASYVRGRSEKGPVWRRISLFELLYIPCGTVTASYVTEIQIVLSGLYSLKLQGKEVYNVAILYVEVNGDVFQFLAMSQLLPQITPLSVSIPTVWITSNTIYGSTLA